MPQERLDKIIKAVERLGIATVICGVLLFGGWRVLGWFGENIALPFANEQIEIMRQTRDSLKSRDENDRLHAGAMSQLAEEIKGLKQEVRLIRREVFGGKPVAVEPKEKQETN